MQPHSLFLLASIWTCGYGALSLKQPRLSITYRTTAVAKIAYMDCMVQDCSHVHWYQQKAGEGPKRILYVQTGAQSNPAVYDEGFNKVKFQVYKKANSYSLTVYSVIKDDEATYYCACWDTGVKYFGTGTKLVVTNLQTKRPTAKILPPASAEIKSGEGTFLCNLKGFYPNVIKVQWAEEGQNTGSQLNAVTGEINEDMQGSYSVNSWLTVSEADVRRKRYVCQYWHEDITGGKEEIKTRGPGTGANGKDTKTEDCPDNFENSTDVSMGPGIVLNFSYNAAYIAYLLLLLKSTFYTSILAFLMYKIKAAQASQHNTQAS